MEEVKLFNGQQVALYSSSRSVGDTFYMVLSVHQAADVYEGRAQTGPFTLLAAAAAATAAAARQGLCYSW